MAELALSVAQTLLAALQCSELKALGSVWYYKSQLEELNKTVTTIKNVFLDAETKLLSNEEQGYIRELRDVLYEADDLFDEFFTHLELKQLKRSRIRKKVSQAFRMFYKVKEIQTKLNSIVHNHKSFALNVDNKPICQRGEETCSYVDVKDIIGRDDDRKAIIEKLLESKDHQNVCFLSIVGVGGLGKTALAQLVYNDEAVEKEFGNFRFWVCVSDQDQQKLDVKVILYKLLKLVTEAQKSDTEAQKSDTEDQKLDTKDAFELEQLQKELQKKLRGKKYMLVLDDVWNEIRAKWVELQKFLMFGERGSRVLVTTRSELTAAVVGDDDHTYRLQGLSQENSWDLFKMVALNQGNYQQKEFLEIGEKIVAKCSNVPLAIKVVGSLLYGQDIKKWKSFEEIGLSKIEKGDNQIMSVLKLSYCNLRSSLKSCFTYCAIFPKDYEIEIERLKKHWMAQGYIVPADQGGQSIDDAAQEYFLILLRRCFFQDVVKSPAGYIISVKIHDLMHDVAQEMAGKEIQIHKYGGNSIGEEVRHWSYDGKSGSQISSITTKLRSYICLSSISGVSGSSQLVPNQLKCLRVLELTHIHDVKSLESIGELLHLRYLDLSQSTFEAFPRSSITKLHNLQTFILRDCYRLRELPHDFSILGKLVHIQIEYCRELGAMPSLSKLPYLKSLLLNGVNRLQYMEKTSSFAGAEETPFFPSLIWLGIIDADELKGWFDAEVDYCQNIRRFPCLSFLGIWRCKKLATFPPCPVVKELVCDRLGIVKQVAGKGNGTPRLATLMIPVMSKLTKEVAGKRLWKALNQSLRTLIFEDCDFKSLPRGMKRLTSLQTLKILSCNKLNALPKWISCLTSLQDLEIRDCPRVLNERCSEPSGVDWPKIQHIPNITIRSTL